MDGSTITGMSFNQSSGSWWQTIPGILTAVAGTITAVAGLLVVLHQIGLLGNKEKPAASSPSTYNPTTKQSEATAASKTPYSVTFPSGTEVTLRNYGADAVYKILAAQVDNRNTGKLILTVTIRLTNKGAPDIGFGSDTFRLVIDGVPRAPINFLNELVDARSAKEANVIFEMPEKADSLALSVANGKDTANIPIVLKKSE